MSYEGYEEYLCEDGHYFAVDSYDNNGSVPHCDCGKRAEWWHSVDQTNGYDESNPDTSSAPTEEAGYKDMPCLDHYGNQYFIKQSIYKPAENSEWRKVPTEEELAVVEAEYKRKCKILRQHSNKYRIFCKEELLFVAENFEEAEAKYDELWDSNTYSELSMLSPHSYSEV